MNERIRQAQARFRERHRERIRRENRVRARAKYRSSSAEWRLARRVYWRQWWTRNRLRELEKYRCHRQRRRNDYNAVCRARYHRNKERRHLNRRARILYKGADQSWQKAAKSLVETRRLLRTLRRDAFQSRGAASRAGQSSRTS